MNPRRLIPWSWLLLHCLILCGGDLHAQVYFTAQYGPGSTWNLYEHRGFLGSERIPGAGEATSWSQANEEASNRVEPISGSNVRGHLVAFSGPAAQAENNFIADLVRAELFSPWIGLTDDEAFGGGEAGTNGLAGLGNPPGDGIGWKWTSGEVFDSANWLSTQPTAERDTVALDRRYRQWFTSSASGISSYIVEYETRSPTPLNLPAVPLPALLPGPAPRAGAFGVREVANNGQIADLFEGSVADAIRSLQSIAPTAIVRDYYAPVIDHQGEFAANSLTGPGRPFEVLQRGDVPFDRDEDFAMVAHGQIVVPEGQGGDWTFSVNSDDGFELYIPGAKFQAVPGSSVPTSFATHYGSLSLPHDRGASPALGHVTLQPGIHDIELVYYENQRFASVELSAAPGRKITHDSSFAQVGAPAQTVVGATPATTEPFRMTVVQRIPNAPGDPAPSEWINSVAQAKELLAAPDANDLTAANILAPQINHDNIAATDTAWGRYDGDRNFVANGKDFATSASSRIEISSAGTYTFGFSVIDGGELTISGARFIESFGEGTITGGGQSLTLDRALGDGIALASVELLPGSYPIEFLSYNRDGDAIAELFVAPGRVGFFDTGAFALLGPTSTEINFVRPAGLQLVPEPASVISGAVGVLIITIAARRRKRHREHRHLV
jgi:hypothetical protein